MRLGSMPRADRRFDDWHAEGQRRFGIFTVWWFHCPRCGLAFTPEHAQGVGVADNLLGAACPETLGGCGFPWFGATTLAEYYRQHKTVRMDTHGTIGIAKDGPRPAFRVFPFCDADLIPADGRPAVVAPKVAPEAGEGDRR